jgi:putative transposase
MDYDHGAHAKYLLMYYMIFVCKYRKKLLTIYGETIKQIFQDISKQSEFTIMEMEGDKDHIHLLIKSSPKISTLQIARRLKQMSTHAIWEKHCNDLRLHFWKENTFSLPAHTVGTMVILFVV